MQVRNEGHTVYFSGVLNEHVDLNNTEAALLAAQQSVTDKQPRVCLDFSHVSRANSSGLLQWLRLMKKTRIPLCYIRTPVWLVEQFNMIDEFFDGDVSVESIYAHFYSPETDSSETHLLTLGTDVPILENYRSYNAQLEGSQLEPDFDERSYFHFISRHLYKAKPTQ
jgi:ABC-type transporter Mla MlaB component